MQSIRDVHYGGVSEAVSLTYHRRQQLFVPALLGLLSKGHGPRNRPNLVKQISCSPRDLVDFA